jgi:hypothetical protein
MNVVAVIKKLIPTALKQPVRDYVNPICHSTEPTCVSALESTLLLS